MLLCCKSNKAMERLFTRVKDRGCIRIMLASRREGTPIMLGELLRMGGVLAFTVSLFSLREFFLSVHVGERRKSNGQRFKN